VTMVVAGRSELPGAIGEAQALGPDTRGDDTDVDPLEGCKTINDASFFMSCIPPVAVLSCKDEMGQNR
jgi:hypothetical protein